MEEIDPQDSGTTFKPIISDTFGTSSQHPCRACYKYIPCATHDYRVDLPSTSRNSRKLNTDTAAAESRKAMLHAAELRQVLGPQQRASRTHASTWRSVPNMTVPRCLIITVSFFMQCSSAPQLRYSATVRAYSIIRRATSGEANKQTLLGWRVY